MTTRVQVSNRAETDDHVNTDARTNWTDTPSPPNDQTAAPMAKRAKFRRWKGIDGVASQVGNTRHDDFKNEHRSHHNFDFPKAAQLAAFGKAPGFSKTSKTLRD